MKFLRELYIGDYFKLSPNGAVYVRGRYDASSKRYSVHRFDDVNAERFLKGSKSVLVDFEF